MNTDFKCPHCEPDAIIDVLPCHKDNEKNTGKQSQIGFTLSDYTAICLLRIGHIEYSGHEKYGGENWSKVSIDYDLDHALHHIILAIRQRKGLPIPDEEKGDDHLGHAACRVLMAMAQEEIEK